MASMRLLSFVTEDRRQNLVGSFLTSHGQPCQVPAAGESPQKGQSCPARLGWHLLTAPRALRTKTTLVPQGLPAALSLSPPGLRPQGLGGGGWSSYAGSSPGALSPLSRLCFP